MIKQEILRFNDGQAALVANLSYFPLTIYTWFGAPTMMLVDEYYKIRKSCDQRARTEKTKVIIVTDMAEMGAPPATVRKALADRAKDETDKSEFFHCYVTSVPNSLIRGMVTALQWIGGEQVKENTNVANMQLALRHAIKVYEQLGITPPAVDPATYAAPPKT